MLLSLIRHAKPLIAPGLCYGVLDVPADAQATVEAAAALVHSLPQHTKLMCSPLQRCTALAQAILALRPDVFMAIEPDLREMDFGAWEGVAWNQIDPIALSAWTDDFEGYRCGGTGESAGQFVARVHAAVLRCALADDSPQVWISHAGVARAIAWLRQSGRLAPPWPSLCQPLCLIAAEWPQDGPGFGQLLQWNLAQDPSAVSR